MRNPLKRDPIAAIETELANLDQRRDTLAARLDDAKARLEAARTARKNALSADPAADLSGLTRAVQEAGDEVDTITSVLADLAEQRADAESRLDAAKDGAEREVSAKRLEAIARTVDEAAGELHAALQALGKAAARMQGALPETLHVAEIRSDDRDDRSEAVMLVSAIIAEGLADVVPDAIPMRIWGEAGGHAHNAFMRRFFDLGGERIRGYVSEVGKLPDGALDARAAAAAVISDRLRLRAKRIRDGEMSADLADRTPFAAPPSKPLPPLVEVYALENFAFRLDRREVPTLIGKWWAHLVPEDAADAAVAAGLALRTDTPEGEKAFADRKAERQRSAVSSWGMPLELNMCRDLGLVRRVEGEDDEPGPTSGGAAIIPLTGQAA